MGVLHSNFGGSYLKKISSSSTITTLSHFVSGLVLSTVLESSSAGPRLGLILVPGQLPGDGQKDLIDIIGIFGRGLEK